MNKKADEYSGEGTELEQVEVGGGRISLRNLRTLSSFKNPVYRLYYGAMLGQMAGRFATYPHGYANWGRLLLKQLNPYYEIAIVGPSAAAWMTQLSSEYLPQAMLVGSEVELDLPLFRDRFEKSKTRIFVCQDNVCQLPVEDPEDAKRIYHIR